MKTYWKKSVGAGMLAAALTLLSGCAAVPQESKNSPENLASKKGGHYNE